MNMRFFKDQNFIYCKEKSNYTSNLFSTKQNMYFIYF